mmetsp:Transcript_20964/g.34161  ORF Transcript_20964/g.34161 Transcript_20964/m.34161 type:complete len:212 (+) Transcript_20964:820-1455(+)
MNKGMVPEEDVLVEFYKLRAIAHSCLQNDNIHKRRQSKVRFGENITWTPTVEETLEEYFCRIFQVSDDRATTSDIKALHNFLGRSARAVGFRNETMFEKHSSKFSPCDSIKWEQFSNDTHVGIDELNMILQPVKMLWFKFNEKDVALLSSVHISFPMHNFHRYPNATKCADCSLPQTQWCLACEACPVCTARDHEFGSYCILDSSRSYSEP